MRSFLKLAWRHNGLAALVAFALVGLAVFDDYGIGADENFNRGLAQGTLGYALGVLGFSDSAKFSDFYAEGALTRFYGVAFEIPLILAERALGLEHSREIHLMRHLLAHLFFLTGGFFAWLLARRMFGSPALALCAMLLFLLHPRIYSYSFFNTKDPVFLSAFMIALYAIHRAFGRKTVWAFACAGVAVGLLASVRSMGGLLYVAALGLIALDFCFAAAARAFRADEYSLGEMRRILANAAAFAVAAPMALYFTWPLLWTNPLAELFRVLATTTEHPLPIIQVFMGDTVHSADLPPHFHATWMAITTPPMTLALAGAGAAVTLWRGGARPLDALRNNETRFRLMLVACLALTLAALAVFTPNGTDGWRQIYFLHAPVCLLAACGLCWLASAASAPSKWLIRPFRRARDEGARVSPTVLARASVYALAALGFAVIALEMASIHPFQHVYFNSFVDRSTPGHLRTQYDIEIQGAANTEGIRYLAETNPDPNLSVAGAPWGWEILSEERKASSPTRASEGYSDFYLTIHRESTWSGNIETDLFAPAIFQRTVYGNPVVSVLAVNLNLVDVETAAPYRAMLADAASGAFGEPAARGEYDIYLRDDALIFLKEDCDAPEDMDGGFRIIVSPKRADDLPRMSRESGLHILKFVFPMYGVALDGACLIRRPLPDYPIRAMVATRIYEDNELWRATITPPPDAAELESYRQEYARVSAGEPLIRSEFDVYVDGGALVYLKETCEDDDTRGRFQLSAYPANPDDLPAGFAELGHQSRNFIFDPLGIRFDGKCMARRELPKYPVRAIETGRWIPGESEIWSAAVRLPPDEDALALYRAEYARVSAGEPLIRSEFDVYVDGGALIYLKEQCAEDDTRGRFLLSAYPANPADLPDGFAELGHESRNFEFDPLGIRFDGKCMARRELPKYPVRAIETGRWIPGESRIWSETVELPTGRR